MYYREPLAARTELAQGTEAKVRTQNFRKTPRQCDRSLHKEPRQRDRSLRKEPPLYLCGVALYYHDYAQGSYAAEMEQAALMAEAKETMER